MVKCQLSIVNEVVPCGGVNNSQISLANSITMSRNGYVLLTQLGRLITLWSRAGYGALA